MYSVGPIMNCQVKELWYCFKNGEIVFVDEERKMMMLYDPKNKVIKSLGSCDWSTRVKRLGSYCDWGTRRVKSLGSCDRNYIDGFSYIETLVFVEGMKPLDMGTGIKLFSTIA